MAQQQILYNLQTGGGLGGSQYSKRVQALVRSLHIKKAELSQKLLRQRDKLNSLRDANRQTLNGIRQKISKVKKEERQRIVRRAAAKVKPIGADVAVKSKKKRKQVKSPDSPAKENTFTPLPSISE